MERSKAKTLTVSTGGADQRLDNFLSRILKDLPKGRLYRVIRRGEVRVNGGRIAPSYRVQVGDQIRIPPLQKVSPAKVITASKRSLDELSSAILYEDKRLLVLNKGAGIAVHSGSGIRLGVIEILRQARPDAPYLELAHRLDRGTSGCLVIAKQRSTLRRFQQALRARQIDKTYLCMVDGVWIAPVIADAPLRRKGTQTARTVEVDYRGGKVARTHFNPLEHWSDARGSGTLLRVKLITGRTHQIRVHAADAGHPLAGDEKYGSRSVNGSLRTLGLERIFLHAERISIPEVVLGKPLTIDAPLSGDLLGILRKLSIEAPAPSEEHLSFKE